MRTTARTRISRLISTSFLALTLALGGGASANAVPTTEYKCGGTWKYESYIPKGKTLWSQYDHSKAVHHSSVINADGVYDPSGWQNAGTRAYASAPGTDRIDEAFYDVKERSKYCK